MKQMKTMDGNTAAAQISYLFTDIAAIYPITPSSTMAELVDEWSAKGKKNMFGQEVKVVEMQSEGGAAGTLHGALAGGAMATTYTASQGLLLMLPTMYKIAGELLPTVFHVSARAIAGHALSIFGDHSDVMACRQSGFAMLCSSSVQETMDFAAIAHLSTIKSRIPFMHFFDGFRTSHEIQKIEMLDEAELINLVDSDALQEFRKRGLNPKTPTIKGTAQNPDIFFQTKEAANRFYLATPAIVEEYMNEITALTGREYRLFQYYGNKEATEVVIAMGSVCEALEEVVDYLNHKGEKVGLLKVRLYRPFSVEHFMKELPSTVEKICVLDRTKENGALGEPLYLDVRAAFYDKEKQPLIVGGRYGLGSKDVTPNQLISVYQNLKSKAPRNGFTIGIDDDVTNLSLTVGLSVDTGDMSTVSCKFWGYGSDGTVGANKDAIKIIGDNTDLYAQGYFSYDSKKSGGVTISHLRFGEKPIRSTYLIEKANYIACHKESYIFQFDILDGLKQGGTFLLNCSWDEEEVKRRLPDKMKRELAFKKAKFYIINADEIAQKVGLGNRINMITQTAFFKLANVLPIEQAVDLLKESIQKTYGKKGDHIVAMNQKAVDEAILALKKIDVDPEWKDIIEPCIEWNMEKDDFVSDVVMVMNELKGDSLPVSEFIGREDGTFPLGTSQYEKRMSAMEVPRWIPENCIQCNMCSMVCPHAAIRPYLIDNQEMDKLLTDIEVLDARGNELVGLKYRIQVSPMDCTGCGSCINVCPAREKALQMTKIEDAVEHDRHKWIDMNTRVRNKGDLLPLSSVRNIQFKKPLLEFSGACAGCGETPYAKLITQLFGDRMVIANATGCSSIWGGSAPSMPYCTNPDGSGPAWANSLFENNAEFGMGMHLGHTQIRDNLIKKMQEALNKDLDDSIKEKIQYWLEVKDDGPESVKAAKELYPVLAEAKEGILAEINQYSEHLVKRSQWIFGGDGWAYDIGFGGLDHVLASGENVNILVFDTEVYSNTGGQSSKSTPTAAVAKFASNGKGATKKDLGYMISTYGEVYVAQIAMGADMNQTIKVLKEAENYNGPSLVIAYAPCINHGIKGGLNDPMGRMRLAVECGYWHLWRYDPTHKEKGINPFVLDSKPPKYEKFIDFLKSETRYASLMKVNPAVAEDLFKKALENSQQRYHIYEKTASEFCIF